ncbi:hypothetical protein ACWJKU_13275 [Methylocaldum sp. MU1018]
MSHFDALIEDIRFEKRMRDYYQSGSRDVIPTRTKPSFAKSMAAMGSQLADLQRRQKALVLRQHADMKRRTAGFMAKAFAEYEAGRITGLQLAVLENRFGKLGVRR